MIKGYSEIPWKLGKYSLYVIGAVLYRAFFVKEMFFYDVPVLFRYQQILRNRMPKKYWNIYDSRMES